MPDAAFSIVVPSYQRRALVCEAVQAICAMDCTGPVELVVVVDGSTDGTAAALRELRCKFPIRVIEQDNRGLAAARNRGAAVASGDILLFLDDDLLCERDTLQQHANLHRAGADAVTGEVPLHPRSAAGLVTDALAKASAWERQPPLSAFHVYGGHLSISKRVFDAVGGFDEDLHAGGYGGEDLDLGLRLVGRYDVRHNAAATAWQVSQIGPREHMRRAGELARSDLRLIAKHPEVATRLLAQRGATAGSAPSLMLRFSRLPVLPYLAAAIAALAAEVARPTPLGSNALLSRLYFSARRAAYWAAFRKGGGTKLLRSIRLL